MESPCIVVSTKVYTTDAELAAYLTHARTIATTPGHRRVVELSTLDDGVHVARVCDVALRAPAPASVSAKRTFTPALVSSRL